MQNHKPHIYAKWFLLFKMFYLLILFLQEDFTHLAVVLCKTFCKVQSSRNAPWQVTPEMAQEIQANIDSLFSRFTIYSKDLDSELNLL